MLDRLTGKNAVSARQLSQETGLRQQTLSRWLQDACSLSVMPSKRQTKEWSIDEKIRILAKAGRLAGAELSERTPRRSFARSSTRRFTRAYPSLTVRPRIVGWLV